MSILKLLYGKVREGEKIRLLIRGSGVRVSPGAPAKSKSYVKGASALFPFLAILPPPGPRFRGSPDHTFNKRVWAYAGPIASPDKLWFTLRLGSMILSHAPKPQPRFLLSIIPNKKGNAHMIKFPTLLILGAGASMPYGLLSGFELKKTVCSLLKKIVRNNTCLERFAISITVAMR